MSVLRANGSYPPRRPAFWSGDGEAAARPWLRHRGGTEEALFSGSADNSKFMESLERKIWFPAKRYGWGWGLPVAWQGWLVLLLYAGGIILSSLVLSPSIEPLRFGISVFVLTVLLVAVCWTKGERPRWRWGKDD